MSDYGISFYVCSLGEMGNFSQINPKVFSSKIRLRDIKIEQIGGI